MSELKEYEINDEEWREYRITNVAGKMIFYRITDPVKLFIRPGGSTHRVMDATGLIHCLPAPEVFGCALVWKPKDPSNPIQF